MMLDCLPNLTRLVEILTKGIILIITIITVTTVIIITDIMVIIKMAMSNLRLLLNKTTIITVIVTMLITHLLYHINLILHYNNHSTFNHKLRLLLLLLLPLPNNLHINLLFFNLLQPVPHLTTDHHLKFNNLHKCSSNHHNKPPLLCTLLRAWIIPRKIFLQVCLIHLQWLQLLGLLIHCTL